MLNASEEGLERFAVESCRSGYAKHVQHRWQNVGGAYLGIHYLFGCTLPRQFHDEGDVNRGIVEKYPVCIFVMLAQAFAVVTDDDDQRVVIPALLFQVTQKIRQR